MAEEKMWTYPELRFVTVNQYKMSPDELVAEVNGRFHGGEHVRTEADIKRITKAKTIFTKEKKRGRTQ